MVAVGSGRKVSVAEGGFGVSDGKMNVIFGVEVGSEGGTTLEGPVDWFVGRDVNVKAVGTQPTRSNANQMNRKTRANFMIMELR